MFAPGFLDLVDGAGDHPFLGAIEKRGLLGDGAMLVGVQAGLVEIAPAEGMVGLDDFVKLFPSLSP